MNIHAPARKGDWMQTASGRQFWPMDPHPDEIDLFDIAHALSNACRYAGHCSSFYSVAQHSVLVSRNVPKELALWGLLHDASEAYLVDIPRPVKPHLAGYYEAEERVMAAVVKRFKLTPETMPAEVKRVDNAILADEKRQLMTTAPAEWVLPEPPLGIIIRPWSPGEARTAFIAEYVRLGGEDHS